MFTIIPKAPPPSLLLKLIMKVAFLKFPVARSFWGVSWRKFLSTTGPHCVGSTISNRVDFKAFSMSWASFLRRQVTIALWSVVGQSKIRASSLALRTPKDVGWNAWGLRSTPLSAMAWLNSSLDRGDRRWRLTLVPPELAPKMVTLSGFPPKCLMFSLTHFIASTWSNIP